MPQEAKGFGPNFPVSAGFEDHTLLALLALADVALRGLSNIVPEHFVGLARAFEGGLAKATELHQRILPLMTIYAVSDPGLGAAKLTTKKLGFPPSPAVCGPILPTPRDFEEAIEPTGLLPVWGET